MLRLFKKLGVVTLLATQVLLFQNCSDAKFVQEEGIANLTAKSCQTNLVDTARTVKILLLVDTSGSNVANGGTDPVKRWRLEAINSLVKRYSANSNISFSLATFQGKTSQAQILSSNGTPEFSNSSMAIQKGISIFANTADDGGTPYKAALELAKNLISRDLSTEKDNTAVYSVVMISDGMPEDYKNPTDLIPDVSAITKLAPGRITLNSAFYYNTAEQKAQINTDYLKTIATIGKGMFITANSNESINLEDRIKVPQEVCN